MIRQDFEANLAATLDEYRRQTGEEPNGETGVCSLIVLGSFTGARLNFRDLPGSKSELRALEQGLGLRRATVISPGLMVFDAIKELLRQRKVSFHGIIAEGHVETGKRHPATTAHSIAVVVGENRLPFGVVDSTASGSFRPIGSESPDEDIKDAGIIVHGRFVPPYAPALSLVLDEAGQRTLRTPGRLVPLTEHVTISMEALE